MDGIGQFYKISSKNSKRQNSTVFEPLKANVPKVYQTRFRQISDFYSMNFIAKFEEERLILTDPKRNRKAWELLIAFSNGVDTVRERQKKALGPKVGQESYRDYLLTVIQSTDDVNQRRNREQILRGLLQTLFKRKDSERLFSPEQRRILWNSASERKCAKCGKQVTWSDLTIDHINPFSRGGQRKLENAALMHRSCNASKGNR